MTLVHFLYLLLAYFVIQLILSVLQTIYSIRANNEKYKAHKALQKGFHVEFSNANHDLNVHEIAEEMSEILKNTTKTGI